METEYVTHESLRVQIMYYPSAKDVLQIVTQIVSCLKPTCIVFHKGD